MSSSALPSIGVITPSFRQAGFIAETIESVRAQDYPALEHWIIDARSDDGTADVVARYQSLPYLHWVSEPDRGQSDAINKGMRLAKSEIVGWLNADDLYFPNALSAVGAAFRDHPDAAVVYGGGEKINAAGVCVKEVSARPFDRQILRHRFYILQPSIFFRRRLFFEVGGLNESSHYAMDWELMLRFPSNTSVVVIPQKLSRLRCYPNTKTSQGGWERMREIAKIGYEQHGIFDRNAMSFFLRDRVSRLPNRPVRSFLQRIFDRALPHTLGRGCMVEGWPANREPLSRRR